MISATGSSSASRRWSGARSPTLSGASTPRKNSVMYCSFTSSPSSARVSVRMTTDVPLGRPRSATGVACERTAHAVCERPVHDEVLLVVHDVRAHVVGGDRAGNLAGRAPRRAGARTPAADDVVGRVRICPERLLRHLERGCSSLRVARPLRDRSSCHPRRLAAVHGQDPGPGRNSTTESRGRRSPPLPPRCRRRVRARMITALPARGFAPGSRADLDRRLRSLRTLLRRRRSAASPRSPNATAFTFTLNGPHSPASVFVMPDERRPSPAE